MKPVSFLGDSLKALRGFPEDARQDAGYQLHKIQCGEAADDCKPLPAVGPGVEELRIWAEEGTFRVIFLARRIEAVYVLHAFQKKSQAIATRDLDVARRRFALLPRK